MYHHVKKMMYTVKVDTPNIRFGNMLLEQFGGANGELAAAMQYTIQVFRFAIDDCVAFPKRVVFVPSWIGIHVFAVGATDTDIETDFRLFHCKLLEGITEARTRKRIMPTKKSAARKVSQDVSHALLGILKSET